MSSRTWGTLSLRISVIISLIIFLMGVYLVVEATEYPLLPLIFIGLSAAIIINSAAIVLILNREYDK